MITKRMSLAVLSALVLSAPAASAQGLSFTNVQGILQVLQKVPCGERVDVRSTIALGRIDITPLLPSRGAEGRDIQFDLTRADLLITPFAVSHACLGINVTVEFREIGYQLARAVRFTGESIGRPEERRYRFSIPRKDVLLYASVLNNLPVQQPETAYQRPSDDLTGEIDLRQGTVELHVAMASTLRFRVGCIDGRCAIDEELKGTQTADIAAAVVTNSRANPDKGRGRAIAKGKSDVIDVARAKR
jgi:hypothetical protein